MNIEVIENLSEKDILILYDDTITTESSYISSWCMCYNTSVQDRVDLFVGNEAEFIRDVSDRNPKDSDGCWHTCYWIEGKGCQDMLGYDCNFYNKIKANPNCDYVCRQTGYILGNGLPEFHGF